MQTQIGLIVESVSAELAELLEESKLALLGQRDFGVENVIQLRTTMDKMAPILSQSSALRRTQPEISARLDRYKSLLKELQEVIRQLRVMLLAKQASLGPRRSQNVAVSRWISAFRQTR